MSQCDEMIDLVLVVGHNDLYSMVQYASLMFASLLFVVVVSFFFLFFLYTQIQGFPGRKILSQTPKMMSETPSKKHLHPLGASK